MVECKLTRKYDNCQEVIVNERKERTYHAVLRRHNEWNLCEMITLHVMIRDAQIGLQHCHSAQVQGTMAHIWARLSANIKHV